VAGQFSCTSDATAGMNNAILLQKSWIQSFFTVTNDYIDPLTLNGGGSVQSKCGERLDHL